jgi:SAM-dependent methyltransferase
LPKEERVIKQDLYANPKYYDLAFCSFRDTKHEVDVIEECIHRYSRIPIKRVLEIACGPSPNLKELVQRGYEYTGLDINESMINYIRKKYNSLRDKTTFIVADMRNFSIEKKADLVFLMGGSLFGRNNQDILANFSCVANSLKIDGLYLLDSCVEFNYNNEEDNTEWILENNESKIKARISSKAIDKVNQLWEHRLNVDVQENGKEMHFESTDVTKVIFPQEFLLLIEKTKKFEFVGWWNNWDINEPIEKAKKIERPLILVRRI